MSDSSHDRALAERATSSFPVSIGTAMALESIFPSRTERYDDSKPRATPIKLDKPYLLLINVETLYRNLISSLGADISKTIPEEKLAETLSTEMTVIHSLCANEGAGMVNVVFYLTDHDKFTGKVHRQIKFREPTTPGAILYARREKGTMRALEMMGVKLPVMKNRRDLPPAADALIVTHYPIELSVYKNYRSLLLVESHTGAIKPRTKWSSKYYPVPNEDMSRLPYSKKLLMLLGDKSHIAPADIKVRRIIIDVSKKGNWTPATTDEKILFDIDRFSLDMYLVSFMKGL